MGKKRLLRLPLPPFSMAARVFAALVGIAATTSLVIGLILYYFAEHRLVEEERVSLEQRSRTANAGAGVFLEGLRNPEDRTFPEPETYAGELVRSVADATGLEVLYVGTDGEPLASRDGLHGEEVDPGEAYEKLGLDEEVLEEAEKSSGGEGRLVPLGGNAIVGPSRYAAVWPLSGDGSVQGILVYDSPGDGVEGAVSFLRYGILGAVAMGVLLAGVGSVALARQITRPLSETRDAAIRVASGDYNSFVPVKGGAELGEMARAFNYMSGELRRHVGEIQRQRSRLQAVLDASPEAVVATDGEGRVTMSNPAASRMLGVGPSLYGRPISKLDVPPGILTVLREASATGAAVKEIEVVGGKTYWAYAARMPEEKENGSASNGSAGGGALGGAILAVRDITEHRSLERAKTDFVSDISHELRTPLTTIQSALDLIGRAHDRLDPLEHRALELADQELKRIRGMVEELLTLAQMDSRQYSLELAPTDLDEVIRSAIGSIEPKAERFGIELYYRGGESPPRCICDAQKVYQVLLNLLDNAIKYSEPGDRVEVGVSEDADSVSVRVSDTGFGIPEEDLPNLFDRFYRVSKDRSRATGGSGLGLAISKQIVELHGGRLSVQSEVGTGSTFDVRLPKAPLPRSANYAL